MLRENRIMPPGRTVSSNRRVSDVSSVPVNPTQRCWPTFAKAFAIGHTLIIWRNFVKQLRELTIMTPNKPGKLSQVLRTLPAAKVEFAGESIRRRGMT